MAHASPSLTPTTLVEFACPTTWKNIDATIDPISVRWANTADKDSFLDYQDNYIMHVTLKWGPSDDRYADDALTVASECALRKNAVVDNYFSKPIDTTTLSKRTNIAPLMTHLLY